MRRASILALPLLFVTPIAAASPESAPTMTAPIAYPDTRRVDVVDESFGEKVADPYRWLENDVRNDKEVADWVAAQNKVTDAYLDTLPGRDVFKARIKQLFDYERFGVPTRKGNRYFYSHNSGLQNQSVLWVRDSLDAPGRVLIDPNGWAKDGATALSEWVPSEDGKLLVYGIQDGGSDWRTVKVLDVATGKTLDDEVKWIKFSNLAWAKDNSGFYYSRFPAVKEGETFQALNENQAVYFHKLGTSQDADKLIYATPETPKRGHFAQVTDDGGWLVITTTEGTDNRYEITILNLKDPAARPRTIVKGLENEWSLAGNIGSKFFWTTDKGASRKKVVTMDVAAANPVATDLIPEDAATMEGAGIVGGQLFVSYLVDAKDEMRRYSLDGKLLGKVATPGIGSVAGFTGDPDENEAFYAFTSFNMPTTVYRYDVKTGKATEWAKPKVAFDPSKYGVEQRFFTSKDGTKVPMFVVKRKDVTGPAPTLLWAYGGFNISYGPAFSAARLAWMEQGGVFVLANIRGGGEYGKAWHDGGRLKNKQNVFDDFIAAGEYLIAQGITKKDGLAIQGGSNGGLLVGAVVNQRPDLFAAAMPAVGVMDMLRFDRWTAGRYWVDDYGYPSKEADWKILRSYSPYHNIASGKTYPAILATTADTDDRVVPGHTFKYTAALQAADIGPKPHLVRIETRAGHGSGKPTDKVIEETSDLWAFAAKWTGLEVKPAQ
ncbi:MULTISPECIES: prolyl oligopeptidase family protein [unclassified Sphingomonas]|uniref:prolyl oligopeptidase family serine peptidase n=1 Tax=unclassified Sphingomonas TaxID=196159 RepID=UPI0021507148|nr:MULTISPECIES: prolyl oligopeptidase family serine peptidase [unclassified Sphingomonas]MCR5871955.1 prolyl oligopeptidase family serine peptidase [Sphingomonas sp. J344]UUX99766.1 prolyl oligopeptidase family serine peptidase [Sphingomonas sp. J315]